MTPLDKMKELAKVENARMREITGRTSFHFGGVSEKQQELMETRRGLVERLWETGLSADLIAQRLRRSRNTIVGDLGAMGLWKN